MHNVPDPYRLLGVGRDATTSQIKAAHRRLAKRYHPDAPEGDQQRFLAVQEAYQLLADPVRRKQWDARHAPGPVRADAGATRVARADGGRRAGGAATRARPATRPSEPQAGAPPGRTGPTWSARNVPWWESRESAARQQAADNRAHGSPSQDAGPRRASSARTRDPRRAARSHEAAARGEGRASAEPGAPGDVPRSDFDVYSRSSGAAWSSAARAYFRKGVDDLPRGRASWASRPRPRRPAGSPWNTGATADAGASGSADESTRGEGRPPAAEEPAGTRGAAAAGDIGPERADSPGTHRPGRPGATSRGTTAGTAAGTMPPPRFTSQGPHANLARARRWAIAGRGQWPPAFQRLVFAVAGWLPPALALAYTTASATGCDRASVSCPANFELVQVAAVAGLLGALLAFPRAAYLAAAGSAGLGVTALLLVIVYGVIGVPQPLPDAFALLTLAFWLLGYVGGVVAARHDWPFERPWLREGWIVGPDAAAPSLGVAHRAPRG